MLTGTVAPDATGQLINRVVAQVPPGVVDPTPSEATDTDTITPMADVAITKTGAAGDRAGKQSRLHPRGDETWGRRPRSRSRV